MRPVAFLISQDVAAIGGPGMRVDAFEPALQFDTLVAPCAARGFRLERAVWDAPDVDWSRYAAAVTAATWDYVRKADTFLTVLDRIALTTPVFNPPHVVRWNIDKGYLADLEANGVRIVPTRFSDHADPAALEAAFDALGADEIVVKPRIGAGAWRQARLRRGAPLPSVEALPPGACLIQPFLTSVVQQGETSLLYFGGVFSHAVAKRPAAGDYRVQSEYGARDEVHTPSDAELSVAATTLQAVEAITGTAPLYARVDLIADDDGAPALMEVELIEPYFYPAQGPRCGEFFAAALEQRLGAT